MDKNGLGRIMSFKAADGDVYDIGIDMWGYDVLNIFVFTPEYGNFIVATMQNSFGDKYDICFPINNIQWIRYERI